MKRYTDVLTRMSQPHYAAHVVGYWVAAVLLLSCRRSSGSPDLFTAMVDAQRAVADQQRAAILLRQHVQNERQRLDQIERLADDMDAYSDRVLSDTEHHIFHPVNYYLMTKRFTLDWHAAIDKYLKPSTEDFLTELAASTANYPNVDNFVMSASALLRLQDTYDLRTTDLSSGHVGGTTSTSTPMSADDCFQLGKVAYNNQDFYHAVLWMSEALRIDNTESPKTTCRGVVLDYLSFASYKQGNVRHAYNLTQEWLQLEPNHVRALNNLLNYEREIDEVEAELRRTRQVIIRDAVVKNERLLDSFRSTPEFSAYEQLCRGETLPRPIDDATRRELVCQYRRHKPIFYIRPLKEELVNIHPRIVIFHDIITDSEIAKIKELAVPKLHRSGVFSLKGDSDPTAGFSSYRTSKSAWLRDYEDPLIARVSQKASALSNLTLETVEELQVLNYGIGGHYEPHFDYVRSEEETTFSEWQGNRVATVIFYLNDVDAGGYTVFNVLGISQPTSKGSCLLWYNLLTNGEGDVRTRHAGCPVLVGTKWVANKWFHYGGQHFSRPCAPTED